MAMEGDKKKLNDLRVVDLKAELEKRDLDKVGVKAVLIERLEKALRDEGHNPEEYLFECEKKTPKRPSKRGEQDAEGNADESLDTTVEDSKEKEEEEEEEEETAAAVSSTVDAKTEPVAPTATAADADEKKDEGKQAKRKEESADKTVPEANGVDNEDSINLTIGEDEEKLLAEEEETSQDKEQKGKAGIIAPEKIKQEPVEAEEKPATENDAEKPTEDVASQNSANPTTEATSPKEEKDKKPKATPPTTSSSRNLWVSGLSSSTRATDLKQVFSKYGKVIGAKVVTNARTPGARCYGYVTMATSDDASKCIQHLHRTELHARMISVERAKGDSSGPPRKSVAKPPGTPTKKTEEKKRHERKLSTSKSEEKKEEKDISVKAEGDVKTEAEGGETLKVSEEQQPQEENSNKEAKKDGTPKNTESVRSEKLRSREVSRERKERDRDRHRSPCSSHHSSRVHSRSPHRRSAGSKQPGVLTFTQIREERERQRLRERERQLREEDRRRREERLRQREIEREQRAEAQRLEREKEKLRLEREKIEAELVRMERERQRLEREKLEREREELKRQQIRFEEARRSSKRPSEDHRDSYGDERKKVATDRRFEGPQSRYEEGSRFERTQNYRVREERRPENDHRVKVDVRHTVRDRYSDASKNHRVKVDVRHTVRDRYTVASKSDGRYGDRSGDSWHTGNSAPQMKQFGSMSAGSGAMHGRDGWSSNDRKSDVGQGWGASDRWVSAGPMSVVSRGGPNMGGPNSMYGNQQSVSPPGTSNVAMGGGPYSGEMFDSYKPPMGPIRKY